MPHKGELTLTEKMQENTLHLELGGDPNALPFPTAGTVSDPQPGVTIGPNTASDIVSSILSAGQPFPAGALETPTTPPAPAPVDTSQVDIEALGPAEAGFPSEAGGQSGGIFAGATRVAEGVFRRADGTFFVVERDPLRGLIPVDISAARAQALMSGQTELSASEQARETRLAEQFGQQFGLDQERFAFQQQQAEQQALASRRSFLAQLASDPGAFLQLAIETGRQPTVPGALAPLFPQLAGGGRLTGGEPIPGFAEFLAQRQLALGGQQAPATATATTTGTASAFGPSGDVSPSPTLAEEALGLPPPVPGLAPQPGTAAFAREQEELFGRGTGNIITSGGVTSGTAAQALLPQTGNPPPTAFLGQTAGGGVLREVDPGRTGAFNLGGGRTGVFDFSGVGPTRPFGVSPEQFAAEQGGVTSGSLAQTAGPQQAQAPLSGFLPTLTSPSAQFFAGLNPTAQSQFGGLERARTGESFQDIAFRLAQRRPPGGGGGGFSRVR